MPVKSLKGGIGVRPLGFGLGSAETEETDPNFNQTVLLLHGDGSEGAGNTAALGNPNYKAFKDNSTSAHALAVAGDAYGNDFSPYYYADGYWSVSDLSGSNYIDITNDSSFVPGTGDFTVEFFLNHFTIAGYQTPFSLGYNGAGDLAIQTGNGDGRWIVYISGAAIATESSTTVEANRWYHIAVVRNGSNIVIYRDGVSVATGTSSTDINTSTNLRIGTGTAFGNPFLGSISNVRISKSAVYTSAFTAPTTPLTTSSQSATNVGLLTCQSNRFLDNSSNSHSLSITGTPKISTNTPFTVTKTANVGSGFFDGNTDNLTTTGSSDFATGTGDYTFEAWVYPFSLPSVAVVLDLRYNNNNNADNISALTLFNATLGNYSAGNYTAGTDIPVIINQWNHIVIQRISGTQYYAVNGKVSSTTSSLSNNLNSASQRATIGGNVDQTTVSMYTGYIADLRVVNGTGVYGTSNFSVPTTSLTAVTNTKLLTCQYSGAVRNVGFVDDSKYNHRIVRVGDTTLGTFSPFSLEDTYWCEFYNTSSDSAGGCHHKILPASFLNDLTIANKSTSTKTIEAWVYPTSIRTNANQYYAMAWFCKGNIYFDCGLWSTSSTTQGKFVAYHNDVGQRNLESSSTFTVNQWYHVAVVIASETLKIYVNGVLEASGTWYGLRSTGIGEVSVIGGTASNNDWNGYISNLRISSTARYTSAFTPSTLPFTSDSDTLLLTNQSNRIVDNSSSANTFTFQNTPKVLPFSPFAPSRSYSKDAVGGSAYFDGTGDYIFADGGSTAGSSFKVPTGEQFSTEFWFYKTSATNNVDIPISAEVLDEFQFAINADAKLSLNFFGSTLTSSPTFPLASNPPYHHCWNHFVVTRDSNDNKIRTFINGNLASITGAITTDITFQDLVIGHQGKGHDHPVQGFIASVRHNVGDVPSAYTTTETSTGTQVFTTPTAPVTADDNTVLLLNFNNAGIIDHTMKNNLESESNTRVSGQQIKFGTGSIYFDGTDDKLVIPHQEYQQLGTGEFTVELFVYFTSTDQRQGFFGNDQGWYFQIYANELEFALSTSAVIERAFSHSINQWYHLAATRDSSNDIRLFIDGTQQGAVVNSTANLRHASNDFHIGNIGPATSRPFKGGYMDEIRITKGAARYTSNFTVPTKAFANR